MVFYSVERKATQMKKNIKTNNQAELENWVARNFSEFPGFCPRETTFYPVVEAVYRPPVLCDDMREFLKKICEPPRPAANINDMRTDISGFLNMYLLSHLAPKLAVKSKTIQNKLQLPEVYGMTIAFVTEMAEVAQNDAARKDAAFLCARHLGDSYTVLVRGLLDFDVWQSILSDGAKRLLEFYLEVLQKEFNGVIPVSWLNNKAEGAK